MAQYYWGMAQTQTPLTNTNPFMGPTKISSPTPVPLGVEPTHSFVGRITPVTTLPDHVLKTPCAMDIDQEPMPTYRYTF